MTPHRSTNDTNRPRSRGVRLLLPLALLTIVAALLTGCGSSSKSSAPTTAGASTATSGGSASGGSTVDVIVIKNFAYSPVSLTVKPGATVTVKNDDVAIHTVTDNGMFDTGDISPGASKTFTAPTTAGSYPYICTIHQFMHGTLVVS